MAYSAVTQPRPEPLRQRGTPSEAEAAHSTRVRPNSTSTEPGRVVEPVAGDRDRAQLVVGAAVAARGRSRSGGSMAETLAGPATGLLHLGPQDPPEPDRQRHDQPDEPGHDQVRPLLAGHRHVVERVLRGLEVDPGREVVEPAPSAPRRARTARAGPTCRRRTPRSRPAVLRSSAASAKPPSIANVCVTRNPKKPTSRRSSPPAALDQRRRAGCRPRRRRCANDDRRRPSGARRRRSLASTIRIRRGSRAKVVIAVRWLHSLVTSMMPEHRQQDRGDERRPRRRSRRTSSARPARPRRPGRSPRPASARRRSRAASQRPARVSNALRSSTRTSRPNGMPRGARDVEAWPAAQPACSLHLRAEDPPDADRQRQRPARSGPRSAR